MKPETIAGVALMGAGLYGVRFDTKRQGLGRLAAMLDVSAWPGWATVAGVALLYVGQRGGRK